MCRLLACLSSLCEDVACVNCVYFRLDCGPNTVMSYAFATCGQVFSLIWRLSAYSPKYVQWHPLELPMTQYIQVQYLTNINI